MKSPLEEIPGVGRRIAAVMERLGIYYAEHESRDAAKLKWWYWKDRAYPSEREENHESAE